MSEHPFPLFEQFVQIANAGPLGVEAGDLISKCHKAQLADMGLVTPKYGTSFKLTAEGQRWWTEIRRVIAYTDPWNIADPQPETQ